jgi:hypothetical protein
VTGELRIGHGAAPRVPVGNRRLPGLAPAPGSPDDAATTGKRSPFAWRVRVGSLPARLGHPECKQIQ